MPFLQIKANLYCGLKFLICNLLLKLDKFQCSYIFLFMPVFLSTKESVDHTKQAILFTNTIRFRYHSVDNFRMYIIYIQ